MKFSVLIGLIAFSVVLSCYGQDRELSGRDGLGVIATLAPKSTPGLLGESEDRRIWTAGAKVQRRLLSDRNVRLSYEAGIMPLFEESDPVLVGEIVPIGTPSVTYFSAPYRPITADGTPLGVLLPGGPVLPVYGARERTFGFAATPLGVRLNLLNRFPVQPSLACDLGFVYSSRDVPIDYSSQFNFTVTVGPGVEIFTSSHNSVLLEYMFQHMSNGGLGQNNPAVDSYTIRVSLSHYRH
jgi:hypothetical protein